MTSLPFRSRVCGRQPEKGSVLIVALLLSAAIAVSIVSYLTLSRNSLQLANRSFYNTSAMNLAETGVEEALWAFNQVTSGVAASTAWSGWTISGSNAKRTFTDFTLSGNASVAVRVYVENYNPSGAVQPKVFSEATVTIPNDTRKILKVVEVDLRRRSRFAMGLVAKDQIRFNGNASSVDSWNSLYDDSGALRGTPVAYSSTYKHASGSVGSTSVAVGSVAVNHADIWGYAAVGTSSTSGISVGTNGIIGPFGSPSGYVDTTRVATDFTANFDSVVTPTSATDLASVGSTLGTAGTTNTYRFSGQISSTLTIRGNVTLILTAGSGVEAIRQGGTDKLILELGATLTIYTGADLKLSGGGVINPNAQASSLQIYGTNPVSQEIDIGGTSSFNGVIYAPTADISIHGNPDVYGSIVGDDITVEGSAKFHYDEALGSFGGENPFGIVKWLELTTEIQRSAPFASF